MQNSDKESTLTPANWKPGDDVMIQAPASKADADKLKEKNDPKNKALASVPQAPIANCSPTLRFVAL